MSTIQLGFTPWPKTTRIFRDITVTEKIDGTNAAITFAPIESMDAEVGGRAYVLEVQSRNRLITPGKATDNYGFAQWANDNADALFAKLGYGRHFGEWWGRGIARRYNMDHRVFSIFNTDMWQVAPYTAHSHQHKMGDDYLSVVPVLYRGMFDQAEIESVAMDLQHTGSEASDDFGKEFNKPEGVCIFHSQTRTVQKFTFDNNDKGKWEGMQ